MGPKPRCWMCSLGHVQAAGERAWGPQGSRPGRQWPTISPKVNGRKARQGGKGHTHFGASQAQVTSPKATVRAQAAPVPELTPNCVLRNHANPPGNCTSLLWCHICHLKAEVPKQQAPIWAKTPTVSCPDQDTRLTKDATLVARTPTLHPMPTVRSLPPSPRATWRCLRKPRCPSLGQGPGALGLGVRWASVLSSRVAQAGTAAIRSADKPAYSQVMPAHTAAEERKQFVACSHPSAPGIPSTGHPCPWAPSSTLICPGASWSGWSELNLENGTRGIQRKEAAWLGRAHSSTKVFTAGRPREGWTRLGPTGHSPWPRQLIHPQR